MTRRTYERCPNCGAAVRAGRPACPECGSDAATGWKPLDEQDYAGTELPEFTDEDYEDVLRDLPGGPDPATPAFPRARVWVILVGLFLVAWLLFTLV